MIDSRKPLFGNWNYLLVVIAIPIVTLICAAFDMHSDGDFNVARREVLLRRIGHELLLQSGDSTSRVLPIKKIVENEYQISFEHKLMFRTDSLIALTRRLLGRDQLTGNYIVNVHHAGNSSVAYSYAISKNEDETIVACQGRTQPTAYYTINIKFEHDGLNTTKRGYLLGSLPFLAFVGFVFLKSSKSRKALNQNERPDNITLGSVHFDPKNRKLIINGNITDLTQTENRLLLIFAASANEVIERSRLQKEIWEDQGIIVGRSLDMFISKLRKKLESDPNINIVVIRGKGYKLELSSLPSSAN